ncbi:MULTISPECIES: AIPR family protein [Nostocales]|uniref:AIPR family protein n=1 Tax=Dolichospermum flos-aquae UHCC 0037 TaxID=2590026 RepID=A0ACC7S4L8_DOLFA|nr:MULTISPECIES: AIPR family protein [Nostocales]MBO1064595.1 AIPR family protein [Anabaena sp. 54]MTJ43463.1 AIPR family protein [Dolichospermum flos-aquae UHCC 0037]
MAGNDSIVLENIIKQKINKTDNTLPDDEFFEIFTFEQILKKYDLSYDELSYGKIGGGDDGGIDGFFIFINNDFVTEDTELDNLKKSPCIQLFLIQSKRTDSFSEKAIEKWLATTMNIFDLEKNIEQIEKYYNSDLINKVSFFRDLYLNLASQHPSLEITYVYATKGDISAIHQKVLNQSGILKENTGRYFSGAKVNVSFIGARELIDSSRLEKSYTLQLKFIENYISRGEDNYVILASLQDYYKFVTYDNNELRTYIFAFNVRDYQGSNVEVNKDIKATLESNEKLDFWWLNNGITILSSKASVAGKNISLDDVQVVNGLQTTNTIYHYIKNKEDNKSTWNEERAILIKIVVTNDPETRDRVIKATNFQTPIPPASLKATDPIQLDIENFFLSHDWFYDRRKNYYKNTGKPIDRIISIPYLAQSVVAIVFHQPDIARSRPASIIKKDNDYNRIFSQKITLEVYLFCAKVMKKLESYIRIYTANKSTTGSINEQWKHSSPIRILMFHLGMLLVAKMLQIRDYKPKDVESIRNIDFSDEFINNTLSELIQLTNDYVKFKELPLNTSIKQKDFATYILEKCSIEPISIN